MFLLVHQSLMSAISDQLHDAMPSIPRDAKQQSRCWFEECAFDVGRGGRRDRLEFTTLAVSAPPNTTSNSSVLPPGAL